MPRRPPVIAPPEFASRADLHRLALKVEALLGESRLPADVRAVLYPWAQRLSRVLHERPVEDPVSWADVTAEMGRDPWELAHPERCLEDESGESIEIDPEEITSAGVALHLVPPEED